MPMDIRTFFSKKGGTKKKQVASSNDGSAVAKSSDKALTSKRKASNKDAEDVTENKQFVHEKRKSKSKGNVSKNPVIPDNDEDEILHKKLNKKRIIVDVDVDVDDDDKEDAEGKKQKPSKRRAKKRAVILDDDDDDSRDSNDESNKKQGSKSAYFRKGSTSSYSKPLKVEVLPESYFQSTKTNKKNSQMKEKQGDKARTLSLDPDEDEAFDEIEEKNDTIQVTKKRSSPTRLKDNQSPSKRAKIQSNSTTEDFGKKQHNRTETSITPERETKSRRQSPRKKQKTPAEIKEVIEPGLKVDAFDVDSAAPECLAGNTFVFTGVLPNISRDESQEFVKMLGGRVTGSVSSKTTYLVVGDVLEDGRPYQEGSKYKKAKDIGTKIIHGEEELYGLAKLYNDKLQGNSHKKEESSNTMTEMMKAPSIDEEKSDVPKKTQPMNNPYVKHVSNPYVNNPYARKSSTATASKKLEKKPAPSTKNDSKMLWVDKYAPETTDEILGNRDAVSKLATWLARWEARFNTAEAAGKSFSDPKGPYKAALLSGPPGIGKTTTATLVAKEAGRDLISFNASDVRSKKALKNDLGDIIGSCSIQFNKSGKKAHRQKRCIVMDEVDGMGGGDRGGMAELIQMIKSSRVPIICICNDRQSQKMKSLVPYCLDLRFRRPVKSVIAAQAVKVASMEGLKVEKNAAEAIAESCGNDVRQVLNCLHMWASNNKAQSTLTYKGLKERQHSINKDEILRLGLFDAARCVLEGRRGLSGADLNKQRDSFFKRNDAFFVDYSFVGLLVQQNYPKVMQGQYNEAKRTNDQSEILSFLDRMHDAAHSMSDFAMAERAVRGDDQNWSLLPFSGMLTVKTGYHAGGPNGGFLPGFPDFTAWMGKNSSKGKKLRILQELKRHMNFKISGGTHEMRLSYLPCLRERFLSLLTSDDEERNATAIDLMDDYGLDRDDVFENLDEFKMDPKAKTFADINSKSKAAFTREYNKLSHKSQALVEEQGGNATNKKRGTEKSQESMDPDVIDEDGGDATEDEDDADDTENIKAMFKKKAKRSNKGKGRKKK